MHDSKLKLSLLILNFVVVTLCNSSALKPYRTDNTVASIMRDIVLQNKLQGFLIFHATTLDLPEATQFKVNDILQQAVKITKVTSLTLEKFRKFVEKVERFGKENTFLRFKENLAARDNVYFILIFPEIDIREFGKRITVLDTFFPSTHCVTKTLLVTFVRRNGIKLKNLFRIISKAQVYNVDILVIEINDKSRAIRYKYRVLQYNPHKNVFRAQTYKKNFKFFPINVAKNLNGQEIRVITAMAKKYHKTYDFQYYTHYHCIKTAINQLNATCRILLNHEKSKFRERKDISHTMFMYMPNINKAYITPHVPRVAYFLTPSFYDDVHYHNFDLWLTCILTICWTISVFWYWAKFFKFDQLTWDPVVIFSMIISVSNPRNPVKAGELVAFVTLISIGFFFGSELVTGLTSLYIVQSKERRVETWQDLRENNITLVYVLVNDETLTWKQVRSTKHFKITTFEDHRKFFSQLLYFKNVSLSTMHSTMHGSVPQSLKINNEIYARSSQINEVYLDTTWQMARNRPWFHSLSDNLMRFYESKVSCAPKILRKMPKGFSEMYARCIIDFQEQLVLEKNEKSDIGIIKSSLLILIIVSFPLAILVLLIEVKLHD